jgi:hypothetical protein
VTTSTSNACGDGPPPLAKPTRAVFNFSQQNLSPNQSLQYEQYGYFDVIGGETGRRYRMRAGCQMNVQQLDKKGRPKWALCFAPEGELVVGDVMLAQKLALGHRLISA